MVGPIARHMPTFLHVTPLATHLSHHPSSHAPIQNMDIDRRTDTPYNYETGVDLREQMTMCDVGDVFTIPANIEKTFDQISNAVAYVSASGAMPIIMGGDHSIGFPTVRG